MRFHIGCSFRPKNVLKFILPFLLGILAFFGYDKVFALENYNSSYNLILTDQEEFLEQTIPGLNYSITTLNEYLSSFSDNGFGYYSYVTANDYVFVFFTANSCPFTELKLDLYGYYSGSSWFTYSMNSTNNPGCKVSTNPFSLTSSGFNQNTLNNLLNKFNHLSTSSYYSNISSISFNVRNVTFNNTDSFEMSTNIDQYFHYFLYDTNTTIAYDRCSSNQCSSNSTFFKNFLINGEEVPNLSQFPTYKQVLERKGTLDVSSRRLPNLSYVFDKSKVSTFESKLSYIPSINASEYLDIIRQYKFRYYGRINHNNEYYTYDSLNCSITDNSVIDQSKNKITTTFNNLTCSSDLTNYDNIYVSANISYNSWGDFSVFNTKLTSNVDYYLSEEYLGDLYEPLVLQNGFKLLVSSNSSNTINYRTDNDYISYNLLSTEDIQHINSTIMGVDIGYNHSQYGGRLTYFNNLDFGTYTKSMYYFYDNYVLHDNMTTNLDLFIYNPTETIISFPVVINGQDTFTYYNSDGTITSGTTIETNYGNIGGNYGSNPTFSANLNIVSSFLDDLSEDLYNVHVILQTFFNSIPLFYKNLILVLFTLILTYIIYKELKR